MRVLFFCLFIVISFTSCWDIQIPNELEGLAPGQWKGTFLLDGHTVPVMYEVLMADKKIDFVFKTAGQELKADSVRKWGDTLFVNFNKTNTQLKLIYQIDQMDGFLYDQTGTEYPIVFAGQHGIQQRFPDVRKAPIAEITGNWQIKANVSQDSTLTGNIRLVAKNNYVEGQLQLGNQNIAIEGAIQGEKLYLSGFDGKTIAYLSAIVKDSKLLTDGKLYLNTKSYFWEAAAVAGVE